MANFIAVYNLLNHTYPLITKTITSGILFLTGDILCQSVENKHDIESKWDYPRMFRMTFFGAAFLGPFGHLWYKLLDSKLPHTSTNSIIKKVAADQLIFGPIFNAAFLVIMPVLERKTLPEAIDNVKDKFVTVYAVECAVWPPLQAINFKYISPMNRVLFVSGLTIPWNTFLSFVEHNDTFSITSYFMNQNKPK